MLIIFSSLYDTVVEEIKNSQSNEVILIDHLGGFDELYFNPVLNRINQYAKETEKTINVYYHQILNNEVKRNYQYINIIFDPETQNQKNFKKLNIEIDNREKNFSNFLCCFLGSDHVSRQFLCSILAKLEMWDSNFCTKNFKFDIARLDGNIKNFVDGDLGRKYSKFFLSQNLKNFYKEIITENYTHCNNRNNFLVLRERIDNSFVHLVGETIGTSTVPFITEKFLQSILSKGLFVGYAQPNWHKTLFDCYGFKPYDKIFNYEFDHEQNTVIRLVKLVEMLLKYQKLSTHDWHDLYQLEKDNLEFNYHHFRSEDYMKNLAKFV